MSVNGGAQPSKFYKYKSLGLGGEEDRRRDDQRFRDLIVEGKIFFPNAAQLNDPFELRPRFDLTASQDVQRSDFIRLSLKFESWRTNAERDADADQVMAQAMSPEMIDSTRSIVQAMHAEAITKNIGLLCVTTKNDNLLMWAHYANMHRGVCVELDAASDIFAQAQPVTYTTKRQPINPYKDTNLAAMEKGLLMKSEEWRYEDEWRITRYEKGPGMVEVPPEAITGVVIGCRASRTTIEFVQQLAKERGGNLHLYRAHISPDEFRLDIRPLR